MRSRHLWFGLISVAPLLACEPNAPAVLEPRLDFLNGPAELPYVLRFEQRTLRATNPRSALRPLAGRP
ncbi:MAG: hypothetical protein ACREMW_07595 [Gemmatimonadales bacterium]